MTKRLGQMPSLFTFCSSKTLFILICSIKIFKAWIRGKSYVHVKYACEVFNKLSGEYKNILGIVAGNIFMRRCLL